ncbi:MAG TPA: SLC13 family permease [Thermomicrobiales bacterium]|nr:SLC13 family permease [Thermomicrobiales bacterium]
MTPILALGIMGGAIILMLTRPKGINEAWFVLAGAVAMVAIGAVRIDEVPGIAGETADVLLFLLGMMVLTGIAERAGVFEVLGEWVANLARGSGRALYVLVFLLGATVTATLSLDVTVITLTPVIYAITRRRGLPPVPFMFACAFVANTASLVFPMSNLTNLLLYEPLGLSFADFTRTMWLPNAVALVTNLVVFLWLFRKEVPRAIPAIVTNEADPAMPREPLAAGTWARISAWGLGGTLVALFALGLAGYPLWWASIAGAAIMLGAAATTRRITLGQLSDDVSVPLYVFVIAMTVLVRGVEHTWLEGWSLAVPDGTFPVIVTGVVAGAVGSNVVNNIPMAVFARSALETVQGQERDLLAYATLIGTNIGPALTTYGSLATMLWLTLIRKRGMDVTTSHYLRVSIVTVPIVLLTTTLALWAVAH